MRFTRRLIAAGILLFVGACSGRGSLPTQNPPELPGAAQPNSACGASSCAGGAQRTTLTYIELPSAYGRPWAFVNGPDGALWFGEWNQDASGSSQGSKEAGIGRLTPGGALSETPLPDEIGPILGAFDGSGNLWFGDSGGGSNTVVGSFNVLRSNGTVSSYPVVHLRFPGRGANARVRFSAATPDGNVWYAVMRQDAIYRVTPDGNYTAFTLPGTSQGPARPNDIALGPDGALWFTEQVGNAIGRMTLDGRLTNVYAVPPEAQPRFIAAGSDGALWFTENGSPFSYGDDSAPPHVVRMTTTGEMTNFAMPPNSVPDSIRAASGGFVFSDLGTNAVGFIDYSGNVIEYPIAYDGGLFGNVQFSLQGSDGSLYFADSDFNRIGKLTLDKKGMVLPQAINLPVPGGTNTQLVGVAVSGDRGPFSASTDNPKVATVVPLPGFPMNFTVTGVGPGSTTLTIKGKGEPMTATITVTAAPATAQGVRGDVTSAMRIF